MIRERYVWREGDDKPIHVLTYDTNVSGIEGMRAVYLPPETDDVIIVIDKPTSTSSHRVTEERLDWWKKIRFRR